MLKECFCFFSSVIMGAAIVMNKKRVEELDAGGVFHADL